MLFFVGKLQEIPEVKCLKIGATPFIETVKEFFHQCDNFHIHTTPILTYGEKCVLYEEVVVNRKRNFR